MKHKLVLKLPANKAKIVILAGDDGLAEAEKLGLDVYGNFLARTIMRTYPEKKLWHVVYIVTKSIAISVIAHEAVHAASYIFDGMGCHADFNNDEHVAYMVQHICHECEDAFHYVKEK